MALETLSEHRSFDGVQGFYRHQSDACGGPMRFGLFRPSGKAHGMMYFLAGLTCTEETFAVKAGAQRLAAELGLILVTPDTSPRDTGIAGATGDWEFGEGASFYLDASEAPWSARFNAETWIVEELPDVLAAGFGISVKRAGICGHSMGGHGALTLALRHPERYASVSALAPIVAPSRVPWGEKAFPRFLGDDRERWAAHDACALVASRTFAGTILIDQGEADPFLKKQLRPERFETACAAAGQPLDLRRHAGYDHSYYFVASFIADHLRHHATALDATL
jgi:S-formylglutathione hydrolase